MPVLQSLGPAETKSWRLSSRTRFPCGIWVEKVGILPGIVNQGLLCNPKINILFNSNELANWIYTYIQNKAFTVSEQELIKLKEKKPQFDSVFINHGLLLNVA